MAVDNNKTGLASPDPAMLSQFKGTISETVNPVKLAAAGISNSPSPPTGYQSSPAPTHSIPITSDIPASSVKSASAPAPPTQDQQDEFEADFEDDDNSSSIGSPLMSQNGPGPDKSIPSSLSKTVSTPVSAPLSKPVSTPISAPVSKTVSTPVSAPVLKPVSAPVASSALKEETKPLMQQDIPKPVTSPKASEQSNTHPIDQHSASVGHADIPAGIGLDPADEEDMDDEETAAPVPTKKQSGEDGLSPSKKKKKRVMTEEEIQEEDEEKKKEKKTKDESEMTEDEVSQEKHVRITNIREYVEAGIPIPYDDDINFNTPLKILRRAENIMNSLYEEVCTLGTIGFGMVVCCQEIEKLNQDPRISPYMLGLKLKGLTPELEQHIGDFQKPLQQIYRTYFRSSSIGKTITKVSPFAQLAMASLKLVRNVHMKNMQKEAQEKAIRRTPKEDRAANRVLNSLATSGVNGPTAIAPTAIAPHSRRHNTQEEEEDAVDADDPVRKFRKPTDMGEPMNLNARQMSMPGAQTTADAKKRGDEMAKRRTSQYESPPPIPGIVTTLVGGGSPPKFDPTNRGGLVAPPKADAKIQTTSSTQRKNIQPTQTQVSKRVEDENGEAGDSNDDDDDDEDEEEEEDEWNA